MTRDDCVLLLPPVNETVRPIINCSPKELNTWTGDSDPWNPFIFRFVSGSVGECVQRGHMFLISAYHLIVTSLSTSIRLFLSVIQLQTLSSSPLG